ncbi:MAG: DNA-binding response regulator [Pedobacter sp.]|jgi:two-component system LytT family response regulator|nr:DNA-binding response regulator [Pedobacter sp.]
MQEITAFIVDDDLQSRIILIKMLQQYLPEISIAGQAASVDEACKGIEKSRPHIVFLDIQMNGETGFDLLRRLHIINFAVIFITSFNNYAVKAFRFNAVDYLLKPIVPSQLVEAVDKVKDGTVVKQLASIMHTDQLYPDITFPPKIHDKIAVPTGEGLIVIPVNEIIYCHADSNYTKFVLIDGKCILSSYTLKQFDEILTAQSFFRAHRSYLINMAHVKMYRRGEGGDIVMSNGHEIELSRTHKDEFLDLLNVKLPKCGSLRLNK